MISVTSNIWFRRDGEWARGCVVGMRDLPPTKTEKVLKTQFTLEIQNELGEKTGDVQDIESTLVEGSFEEFELVKLRNDVDDIPDAASEVVDLITLNHLHEPAILTALRGRFDSDIIYTNTGPILLAVVLDLLLKWIC